MTRRVMTRVLAIVTALVVATLGAGGIAHASGVGPAWWGDHFDGATGGQSVYESGYIHSQAVYLDGKTYVAYQGKNLDAYVVAYDHAAATWTAPVYVGHNPLHSDTPPDTHGAPALLADPVSGHLHIFFGAHGGRIYHKRTTVPGEIGAWTSLASVGTYATYPQAFNTTDGVSHLFYRNDTSDSGAAGYRGWMHATSVSGGEAWTAPVAIAEGQTYLRYYAAFRPATSGDVHVAMVAHDMPDPFDRRDVFYMRLGADGTLRNAAGAQVTTDGAPPSPASLTATALVYSDPATDSDVRTRQNELVVADDTSGQPVVGYLSGPYESETGNTFYSSRYDSVAATWTRTPITTTDHFMDASALEFSSPTSGTAYLTTPGSAGYPPIFSDYRARGGDIERWVTGDGGASWTFDRTVIASTDPDRVFNDPQTVYGPEGEPSPKARLIFCEWDNDTTNFFHKIYLWGEDGFVQRWFTPRVTRLGGNDRYEAAVSVSKRSFPVGAKEAVVVNGQFFTDALFAAPWAQARNAPLLLVRDYAVGRAVLDELKRLKPARVWIVGGTRSVPNALASSILGLPSVTAVSRIDGANRYDLARNVALRLRKDRYVRKVVVVNGAAWPDALSIAPLAAVKGWPILLASTTSLPRETRSAISGTGAGSSLVVGGEASISGSVMSQLPSPVRIGGADRYEVAANAATYALGNGLGFERFGVASGEVFADALSGGPMLARARGPMLLVRSGEVPSPIRSFVAGHGTSVQEVVVIGGPLSVSPSVSDEIAGLLAR